MPDRYGDEGQEVSYIPDEVWEAERRKVAAVAIEHCGLCDKFGYTPSKRVCDHENHAEAAARGMAVIREQMGWKPGGAA